MSESTSRCFKNFPDNFLRLSYQSDLSSITSHVDHNYVGGLLPPTLQFDLQQQGEYNLINSLLSGCHAHVSTSPGRVSNPILNSTTMSKQVQIPSISMLTQGSESIFACMPQYTPIVSHSPFREETHITAQHIPELNFQCQRRMKDDKIRNVVKSNETLEKFHIGTLRNIPANHSPQRQIVPVSDDEEFKKLCSDKSFKINPSKLGFIPKAYWQDKDIAFGDIVLDFFKRKNNINCRFRHKLYNAILLGERIPKLNKFTGVSWVSNTILRVDKASFGRLLGITSIDGAFFHKQGNFTTHGFADAPPDAIYQSLGQDAHVPNEKDSYRLLYHTKGCFVRGVSEEKLESCKWISWKKP